MRVLHGGPEDHLPYISPTSPLHLPYISPTPPPHLPCRVRVLQGLSGTGKGTTVDKLKAKLPKAVAWSNGNVFRSLTLLAVTRCEADGKAFSEAVLTAAVP